MKPKTKPSNRTKPAAKKVAPAVYVRLTPSETHRLDFICKEHKEYRAEAIRRIFHEHCLILENKQFFRSEYEAANGDGH